MTRQYELCYILRQDTLKSTTEGIHKKIIALVEAQGGKVQGYDQWPVRYLTYPIKREKRGVYTFSQIQTDRIDLNSLHTYLANQEAVLRSDVFCVEEDYDYDAFKKRVGIHNTAATAAAPAAESHV